MRKDFYDRVKMLDALPLVHGLWTHPPDCASGGLPPAMDLPKSLAGKLRNFGKFYSGQGLVTEDEMAVYRQGMKSPRYPYE